MLLLTACVAIAIAMGAAWPTFGALIGPSLFLLSFAACVVFTFARRTAWGAIAFRCSMALLAVVVLLYLSLGPASWAMARFNTPGSNHPIAYETYSYIYRPIATNAIFSPEPIRSCAMGYTAWWMPNGTEFHDWGLGIGWSVPGWTYTVIHY
jgi:hypothetical protein